MDTNELARALQAATEDLDPRPGFTTVVVRSGRRRRLRNRVMVATAAATVTALAGGATYAVWLDGKPGEIQAADARLSQPTKGNLAGDRAFLNAAAAAWRSGNRTERFADLPGKPAERLAELRGQPHVYWAGDTPAGRAAVIMQDFVQSRELTPGDPDGRSTLIGLVATDPTDGGLKVLYLNIDYLRNPATAQGFLFRPANRTILVVAGDSPLWLSTAPATGRDGRITREWQSMPITDGVALATLPEGVSPFDARVLARPTRPAPDDRTGLGIVRLEPNNYFLEHTRPSDGLASPHPLTDRRLKWYADEAEQMPVGDTGVIRLPDDVNMTFINAMYAAGMADFGAHYAARGEWSVVAGLTDGSTALVSEHMQDEHPSRIYAVLLKPDGSAARVVAGELVDPAAVLPVKLRLPDAQGWVVAQYGARFAFRTSTDGPWQEAGTSAALLPDAAVQVRVNLGGEHTVDLPR